ncbi:hypothetical protein Harman_39230 [Haloarcula mannanilytica]|uniref:Ribbon-helix-helix protein n=1 Tax=Haloarcula mannanilytica TaxID=2509225 RepID=A0A4C2EN23_9EURY|nr:hypothetical protein [Haloarcula mannanilytica]GCF15988.1 hypothetical protein Harman_39230 [Haloarcula mannanilytica]
MSESITLSMSAEKKKQIVTQAEKNDETITQFLLKAAEQRISRELQEQRATELGIEQELQDLADSVTDEVSAATDVDTDQELCHIVALWELISSEYDPEKRAAAMEEAPEKLQEQVAKIGGGDSK